ncbi:isochorismate synthase [Georgenia sp. TF02-10]|uniref:isochorismate synthase n=1 Tax=Georgenia sp. TF02-10 TaxID=2917725 RepID=UPI001FA7384D|nr:isochorismate synthase [Georgenia sp. TF02-10]UNX54421.1 isochorismate synthase [Georgenia sp. TF02-10]
MTATDLPAGTAPRPPRRPGGPRPAAGPGAPVAITGARPVPATAAGTTDAATGVALDVRTAEIDDVGDLLALLPGPDVARTFSWVRRGEGVVGWGSALRLETAGPDRIRAADEAWARALRTMTIEDEVRLPGTGPVAFGSFAFADTSAAGGVLVVPEVVVGRRDGRCWVTTVVPAGDGAAAARAATLRLGVLPPPAPVTAPGPVGYGDGALSAAAWTSAVAAVVRRIRAGEVTKVVMARDVVATTAAPVDVRHLLGNLAADYPGCWTFSVDGLVGATPELLVRREKGLAACRVLAGTIRRTGRDAEDLLRAAELARSSKDLEEHELAVASLVRALRPYCASINVPEAPFVLHLPNVMHLASDVTGVVDGARAHPSTYRAHLPGGSGPSSLALAAALHPTAAVGGTPTAAATAILAEAERMDRARYAGPVGWIGADGDGEWGIALRSGEVAADRRHVRLFAGCGIVGASDPAAELAESEAKLSPMRQALGG